jgi:uncharacterized protein YhaN
VRLRRLDLLRYGRFTGRSIGLPASPSDLHIIFGPNEAGKSTALAAIEDLLFGIPAQSSFNFLHEYKDMRIGALLESGDATLEFLRRKGNKDTLLGTDDLPLPGGDTLLQPFLAGADRAFFERMFSLDHLRLEQGGREILDARDEIGQMLFSAGAGIGGLRQRLGAMEGEADSLWGARKSAKRLYTQAADRLEQAERDLREHTLTAAQWQERKAALAAAESAHAELEAEYERMVIEDRRLGRIRRVYRDVRRKQELTAGIGALGNVAPLPEAAAQELADAERRVLDATARIDTLAGQLRRARDELAGLSGDTTLLLRDEDIQLMHARRIEVQRAQKDLPRRQAELGAAEMDLRVLAAELGWKQDDVGAVIAAIPPRAKLALVRALLVERGECAASLAASGAALADAEALHSRLREHLGTMPALRETGRLSAAIRSVRDLGDLVGRLRAAEGEFNEAQRRVQRLHGALHPAVPSPEAVAGLRVPARAAVQRHRDLLQDWEQRERELRRQLEKAEEDLRRTRGVFERSVRDEGGITGEQLTEARRYRDALWDLVRRRHILGMPVPEEARLQFAHELEDLAASFEPALHAADAIADQRFENAAALGRLAELARGIEEHEAALAALRRRQASLTEEGGRLRAEWLALWAAAPFELLGPDAMLQWLDARAELVQALEARDAAGARQPALQAENRQARELLLAELGAQGLLRADLEADALPVLLERAVDLLQDCERAARERLSAEQSLRDAEGELERRRRDRAQAEAAWSRWQDRWHRAVTDLGLVPEADPQEVARQADTIDELRDLAQRINGLRHDRIGKIQADITDFARVVDTFVNDVTPDLRGRMADEAVAEIERRLAEAREIRKLQEDRQAAIRKLEAETAELDAVLGLARHAIDRLRSAAGVETVEELRQAIERSDTRRRLHAELDATLGALEQDGDGLPVAELERECAAADVDRIAARQETLRQQLDELRERRDVAVENRSRARAAFAAIGGDDAAARAAAARQEALAGLGAVAERYVRVRSAAVLLKWAIDRYRREKQAPLLGRAGEIFAALTHGAFTALRVEYDDRDQPHLTGLRGSGDRVPVPGLSTGTADQLYLALRVASIEDYLERAPGLPFVADDLFINFDDERAGAGFDVLAQLAAKTQVLFFTHHRHLVDIARARLGAAVRVEDLAEG